MVNLVNKRTILLLVEGAKVEVDLFNKVLQEYELDFNYEIYSYNTNIYELYNRMFKGNEDELESLDLIGILKERDPGNELLNKDFSDILLVFDYDPQDPRFSEDKINLMLSYFNESTDNGKLYINYPMVESFKHFKSDPDEEYRERTVDYSVLEKKKYKQLVNEETKYPNLKSYNKQRFNSIILHNIKKSNYIANNIYEIDNIKECYYSLNYNNILDVQNSLLKETNKIYILNTCLFFICDYKMQLILS